MTKQLFIVMMIPLWIARAAVAQPIGNQLDSIAIAAIDAITPSSARPGLSPRSWVDDDDLEWARLRTIDAGQDIGVTVRNSARVVRTHVMADDRGLTVLNLVDPPIPSHVAAVLRETTSRHRDYFERVANGGTVVVDNIRLTRSGVFVGDERVAEFDRVLTTIPRRDVVQVTIRQRGRGFWGHLGPLGGYFLGGFVGGIVAARVCRCDGGFLPGLVVGGVAGGVNGFVAAHRETERTVYTRAEP